LETAFVAKSSIYRPRIGFLGTGWIGRNRMERILKWGEADVAAIADISRETAAEAAKGAPGAEVAGTLDDLLQMDLDGIAIATPSAFHCRQAIAALERGISVFCQKPLGRTARETTMVVEAARAADRLLAVDFSYRHTTGIRKIRELIRGGVIGEVFAGELVFHNAYGPDKPWFYDPLLSGGGCLMDLGIHLFDLGLWMFEFPRIRSISSSIFHRGKLIERDDRTVEDYAVASVVLENGCLIRVACSWNLPAGRDAVIGASFYGTEGGVCFRNVDGSFYDFTAEHFTGTVTETLASPPDDWGGRAAVAWAEQLRESNRFNPAAERLVDVAAAIDAAYSGGISLE
jgi:predicted dehydrogenase